MLADTSEPPYYAVIFTSLLKDDIAGYADMANQMVKLAEQQEGFLGVESVRDGLGITVSYWKNLESIKKWKQQSEHIIAQRIGKERWYKSFITRIAKVKRHYSWQAPTTELDR